MLAQTRDQGDYILICRMWPNMAGIDLWVNRVSR